MQRLLFGVVAASLVTAAQVCAATTPEAAVSAGSFQQVLLISIDGMHQLDLANCVNGVLAYGGTPYCPNLARLVQNGWSYVAASTSRPSDSFPGLTALVTGGTPRST